MTSAVWGAAGTAAFSELIISAVPDTSVGVELEVQLGSYPGFPYLDLGTSPTLTGSFVSTLSACQRGYVLAGGDRCVVCVPGTCDVLQWCTCGGERCRSVWPRACRVTRRVSPPTVAPAASHRLPGEYSWTVGDTRCHACPEGASCAGGDAVEANVGWWRRSNDTALLYPCDLEVACVGASKCAEG